MTENEPLPVFITDILQNPIPQYLLGVLPAILILGDSPFLTSLSKTLHVFICLGCPFAGLFYFLNINTNLNQNDVNIDSCAYWLPADRFYGGRWPFGFHARRINCNSDIRNILERCISVISTLDRCACLISLYFITIGIIVGIIRAIGPCYVQQDWPSIPLLLVWTFPALLVRLVQGKTVARNPIDELQNVEETIDLQPVCIEAAQKIRAKVVMILVLSIAAHWLAVLITFYTRPIGFGCRSKYLTVISSIWTFNNIVCFIFYYLLDRPPPGIDTDNDYIHIWFQICGKLVATFLIAFGVLSHDSSWWVSVFGNSCSISSCTEEGEQSML
ncbi:3046_t:CDS:1 [Paraglomus occultum]|uniref:3046_t:CDS:1 n=1 Tax=Paraglomus occultum TaxID=144539 RepID=A0A9N9GJA1_9GLOM|nr:3046_t:CDS:1 [Paraglomus occultum]